MPQNRELRKLRKESEDFHRQEKGGRTIFGHEKSEQVLGELEAELGQGTLELRAVYGPRAIPVETPEYMLPVLVFNYL